MFLLLLGCSSEEPEDPIDPSQLEEPTEPKAVRLPTLTPCPAGWVVTASVGFEICEPFPAGPQSCGPYQAHFPGDAGCTRIGTVCPAGDFPSQLPSGQRTLYVLAGASGHGTEAEPYGTIAEATARATPRTIIALGKGTYDELVNLPESVTLWGACVAETLITYSSQIQTRGVVKPVGNNVTIRNLRIGDTTAVGFNFEAEPYDPEWRVHLEDVAVIRATDAGIVIIRHVLTAHNLLVAETRREVPGLWGDGMYADYWAKVELSRAAFVNNANNGIEATNLNTVVHVEDSVLSNNEGEGLHVKLGADVSLERVAVDNNRWSGIFAHYARVRSEDVVVRNTRSADNGHRGFGLSAFANADVELVRTAFTNNREAGIWAVGTEVRFEDVVIANTQGNESGIFGDGLLIQDGAVASLYRTLITDNHHAGVSVSDALVEIEDVVIRNTEGREFDGQFGIGLHVQANAELTLLRARIENNTEYGILAYDARVRLEDLSIEDTKSNHSRFGTSLGLSGGTIATLDRAHLETGRDYGIWVQGVGSKLTMSDVEVEDTLGRDCADTTCRDYPAGIGIAAVVSSKIEAVRFRVRRSRLCGVLAALSGSLDLKSGIVEENAIGACIQNEGYDLDRLTNEVFYMDNDINLDATTLPVPSAGPSLPEILNPPG